MKIAIMQPYVFPYLGYFQLINAVDTFVFYDDVHFIKKGFINRNFILSNNGKLLFTIPCKKVSQNKLIKEVELNFDSKERRKFLSTIQHNYSKAPHFEIIFELLKSMILGSKSVYISELAIESIQLISNYLQIKTDFKKSSEYHAKSQGMEKTERLIHISKSENAKSYYNPIGGELLYSKSIFNTNCIDLYFLKSIPISYKQFNDDFVANLSIIDVLMFNSVEEIRLYLDGFELK